MSQQRQPARWTSAQFHDWLTSQEFSPSEAMVLQHLARWANMYEARKAGWTDGLLVAEIAKAVHVTRRWVNVILERLRDAGVIFVEYRRDAKDNNMPSRFYLKLFMDHIRRLRPSGPKPSRMAVQEGHEVQFNQDEISSKISTVQPSSERIWDVPAAGSVRHSDLAETIRDNLPADASGTCVDFVIRCFREVVSKDQNPVTLARLIGFCQKFRGPGKAVNRRRDTVAMIPGDDPRIAAPARRGDCWDDVAESVFKRSPGEWQSWFASASVQVQDDVLTVTAPTRFIADYLRDRYGDFIRGVTGHRVVFEVAFAS